jgi:Acetoacetate decarboxylase (ADC)
VKAEHDLTGVTYPPAPWRLRGEMFGAVLRLPRGAVPADLVPVHTRSRRRDGSVIAVAAWVDYQPGSVLTYRELMVVSMTGLAMPLTGTVLRIWVSSVESLMGGRKLWRIPKDLAEFTFGTGEAGDRRGTFTGSIRADGREQASYRFVPRFTVPGKWPSLMAVDQDTETGQRHTLSSMRGRLQVGRGNLHVPDDSELAFLNTGSTIAHLALRDFRAVFGRSSKDLPPARRL